MSIFIKDDNFNLDGLNSLIKIFCHENQKIYQTTATLNLNSTFEDVVNFYNAFKIFEDQYNYKKKNSPNFRTALEIWVHEIEIKVNISSPLIDNDEYKYSLLSDIYFRTILIKKGILMNVYNNIPILKVCEED